MPKPLVLHPDRLFTADPGTRAIARRLHQSVQSLPIISPHGHTDPQWFASNANFGDPTDLLLTPDHYVFRMLYSRGIPMESLGVRPRPRGAGFESGWRDAGAEPRTAWRLFAANYHLFRGTPSRLWLDWVFAEVFGLQVCLESATADHYYDQIAAALHTPAFKPRALFERFRIEVLATTESPLDPLRHHQAISASGWHGRIISTFRPDPVVDPAFEGFVDNLSALSDLTGEDCLSYRGYLAALRQRRAFFAAHGATATDHGHPTAATADLTEREAEQLFGVVARGTAGEQDAELFRAHMLTVMAGMSLDDGLVMQIHPGSFRNHNPLVFERFGRDKGADIPTATDYVTALRPLLNRYGNKTALTIILFTLDETAYARELAPLAGHYPCLKLGPPWWFHDSPQGMRRFRQRVTETAGFYNTAGFNDDTRAFLSIPARHDVARRMDCGYLAQLVAEHRLEEWEAAELAVELAYSLAKRSYKL
ncbi:MAG TPA: glucuronate isomerase [Steroidobacteraceae bacterium]|jgi:glucuronate isomerase|nr:glucuronate isomerase [Steroidobacteraceae bacterium]